MTMSISKHFFNTKPSVGQRFIFMLRKGTDFSEESGKKSWGKESDNESSSKFIPRFNSSFVEFVQPCFCFSNSEEFMNVFMRIGFGSTIKLVSFDKGQVVTFNSKHVCSFRNIKKVTEVVDVKNWRVDNSWVLWWIVSLIVWNSPVSSSKYPIQSTFRFRKNIDFAELIWEDFSYQIDNKQLKKGRRKIMPYPRFTKIIINHFLSVHKFVPKGLPLGLHTIKDDGVLSEMKFVRIGEDNQEYGKAILDTLLTDAIKQSEAYKAFIGYSTALVPPKKTRGKGSKGKQQEVTTKKKTVITIDDNIIIEDPDVAFELGKSISKTDAKIADETRRVHETHARIITKKAASEEEFDPEPANRPTERRRPSGITFRDTLNVPKKKSGDRSQKLKGIKVKIEEEQLAVDTMQAIKAIKQTLKSQPHAGGSSEGTGITPGVPDELTVIFTSLSEGTGTVPGVLGEAKGTSEAKADSAIDWEKGARDQDDDDDDDKSIDIEKTDDEKETDDEFVSNDEYVHDDMDKEMKDAEVAKTGKDEKTEEVKDDQAKVDSAQDNQATIFASTTQKSSGMSVSSGFGNQFLNLSSDNFLASIVKESADTEINSLLDIQIQQEVPQTQSPSLLNVPVSVIPEQLILSTAPPPPPSVTNLTLVALDEYDQQCTFLTMDDKRRRTKEFESSTSKDTSKGNSPPKTLKSDKSGHAKESVVKPTKEVNLDAAIENVVNSDDQQQDDSEPQTDSAPKHDWFKQPLQPPTPDPEWNMCQVVDDQPEQPWFNNMLYAAKEPLIFDELMATPIDFSNFAKNRLKLDKITKVDLVGRENLEGNRCPFDLSKTLPLKGHPCHLTVAAEYFFNNDLEYLKSTDSERKYTTSITKMKATRYELVGIEDMIPKKWSTTKVGYDKDVAFGIKHWGPKHKLFYKSQINRFSKHDVFSHMKILSMKSVTANKLHSYGYLNEIMVRITNRQLYKFKEGDFVNLHLNDIEDILLLVVQHKLFHLDGEVIKNLNITKPQKDFPGISTKELYTPSFEPPGVVYEDLSHRKRLMRADELYKFSDGTLKKVHDTLHHRLLNFRFGYNKDMLRREWSAMDKKRAGIMVDLIDKQMLERRILKNLEMFVGARELKMDYKLMQRTV
ncbi:hypothetical protein Tco_1019635 [Tanacetum coccineum]|uniref:Uncharacterized protein n=1 Tax=Tanacetum coccineum TaxID=301880 RepID=A0ABQ5FXZ3_9ASTR